MNHKFIYAHHLEHTHNIYIYIYREREIEKQGEGGYRSKTSAIYIYGGCFTAMSTFPLFLHLPWHSQMWNGMSGTGVFLCDIPLNITISHQNPRAIVYSYYVLPIPIKVVSLSLVQKWTHGLVYSYMFAIDCKCHLVPHIRPILYIVAGGFISLHDVILVNMATPVITKPQQHTNVGETLAKIIIRSLL